MSSRKPAAKVARPLPSRDRSRVLKAPLQRAKRVAKTPSHKRTQVRTRALRSLAQSPASALKLGARGSEVKRLQQMLAARGFKPGAIDGDFGLGTEAAVLAFQRSSGLLADGVAGPRTLAALGLTDDSRLPSAVPQLSVQVVAAMCPGAPIGNIKTYLPALVEAMSELDLTDRTMLLMAVATICAETGRFAPLDEYRSRFNTSPAAVAPYFDLYDHRADLGNRGAHDGANFKGRGFVQLTGRANYTQYGHALGLGTQLVRNPKMANDPLIAARVLARFLKDRELKIKRALLENNYAQARRYVNGGSHGLAEFTRSYLTGEQLLPSSA